MRRLRENLARIQDIKSIQLIFFLFLCTIQASVFALERINVSSSGVQANKQYPNLPAVTNADGRFVAFTSDADNLVKNDTNNQFDVFIHDRQENITERVSVSSTGEQGNNGSFTPAISSDGRFIAFASNASNLVDNDVNDQTDIFIHDRLNKVTELVSVASNGAQGDNDSNSPSMSADGLTIAFTSSATNFSDVDIDEYSDVFVHNRDKKTTEKVNFNIRQSGFRPTISPNGRVVAYLSHTSGTYCCGGSYIDINASIFIYDRDTGITEKLDSPLADNKLYPSFSHDGRYIAYSTEGCFYCETGNHEVYVYDRKTQELELISHSPAVAYSREKKSDSFFPSISADGRFVAFMSRASDLVANDSNRWHDIFIYDRESDLTERVSITSDEKEANRGSFFPSISANGKFIVFNSDASNLVSADTNRHQDIFLSENPLINPAPDKVVIEKLINHRARLTSDQAAQLLTGTRYLASYKVTNNSTDRIYRVQVFEDEKLVCNFYALNPGESKQGCEDIRFVMSGVKNFLATVSAIVTDTGKILYGRSNAYYNGLTNAQSELNVTHYVNNQNADTQASAVSIMNDESELLFRVENTGELELYRVKTFYDPVIPTNSGWKQQCVIGTLMPGEVRYCKRTISHDKEGLNFAYGRAQGEISYIKFIRYVNSSNPTYYQVAFP